MEYHLIWVIISKMCQKFCHSRSSLPYNKELKILVPSFLLACRIGAPANWLRFSSMFHLAGSVTIPLSFWYTNKCGGNTLIVSICPVMPCSKFYVLLYLLKYEWHCKLPFVVQRYCHFAFSLLLLSGGPCFYLLVCTWVLLEPINGCPWQGNLSRGGEAGAQLTPPSPCGQT